jgi:hypothetical protein
MYTVDDLTRSLSAQQLQREYGRGTGSCFGSDQNKLRGAETLIPASNKRKKNKPKKMRLTSKK